MGVPETKKGIFNVHVQDAKQFFKGFHVHINARSNEDLDENKIQNIQPKFKDFKTTQQNSHIFIQEKPNTPEIVKIEREYSKNKQFVENQLSQIKISNSSTQNHSQRKTAKVIFKYIAEEDNEINISENQTVSNIEFIDEGFWILIL